MYSKNYVLSQFMRYFDNRTIDSMSGVLTVDGGTILNYNCYESKAIEIFYCLILRIIKTLFCQYSPIHHARLGPKPAK